MSRKLFYILSYLMMIATLTAACSPANITSTPTMKVPAVATKAPVMTEKPATREGIVMENVVLPEVDPSTVTGDVVSAGSSTVFPLAEAIAELFTNEGYTGKITIDSIGSGAGFERFCRTGETDVSNASRAIRIEEIANCTNIDRTPIEFRVGSDALAVVMSTESDFVTNVSSEELAMIFSDEVSHWSDIRPEWPAEEIQRFIPGTDSGTFDYFVESIMRPAYLEEEGWDAGRIHILKAPNTQLSEDDNVLVQGITGSPYAVGFFGYAYYYNNTDVLRALSINGVEPSEETARSNEYPITRPIFIYSDAIIMQEKPQVAAYINFFLSRVNEVIEKVGYFPASPEALNASKRAWLDAMSGMSP